MKQGWGVSLALFLSAVPGWSQARPAITGISHMSVYTSDPAAAERFYGNEVGAMKGPDPQNGSGVRYYLSPTQFVEVLPLPADHGISRMEGVAFETADASGLHDYLVAHHYAAVSPVAGAADGSRWFETKDPEGNKVEFYQHGRLVQMTGAEPVGRRIIHVGYEVHSKAAEDRFFRELLGFRAYWYGAMQANKVDWVSQQVPNGSDWLEYMLVGEGSTTPLARVDQRELGVLNHFSIGVPNMERAVTVLYAGDRLPPRHDGPQMGKDGKWQANLYDPDGTRVELMEFQPVMKPCCSSFTADSPAD